MKGWSRSRDILRRSPILQSYRQGSTHPRSAGQGRGEDLGTGGGVWGRSLATDPIHREGAGAGRSRFTLQHPAGGPTGNQSVGDRDVTPEERRVPSASGDKRRIPSAPGGPAQNQALHHPEPPFPLVPVSFYLHNLF